MSNAACPSDRPDHPQRRAAATAAAASLARRYNLIALLRLACFLAVVVLAAAALAQAVAWALLGALAGLVVFLTLALWHGRIHDLRVHQERLADYHRRGEDRLAGRWRHGQDDGARLAQDWHPYASDLDLLGPGGFYALLNTAGSEAGRRTLGRWLLHDEDPHEAERRALIAALVPHHDWRAELAVASAQEDASTRDLGAEVTAWLGRIPRPSAVWVALTWVVRLWALVALAAATPLHWPAGFLLAFIACGLLLLPLDLLALRRLAAPASPVMLGRWLAAQSRGLRALAEMPVAQADCATLAAQSREAAAAVSDLARIVDRLVQRSNPFYAHLSGMLLLQWRTLGLARAWAKRHADRYAGWIDLLGRGEALAALATYAAEQGGCWAEIANDGPAFMAEDLAHPLLAASAAVGNDLTLASGQVLLLTGANASGKSTLLRAICLAVLMARIGLPVRARRCRLRLMRLATVMRVHDDLLAGRSRFQAEVENLRRVLDRVHDAGGPVLIALDEILGGTNSRERYLGARSILAHLRDYPGLTLVTTHDLELAAIGREEPERVVLAHFADRAVLDEAHGDVVFDYRLRHGVLTTTNALRVMAAAGLPADAATGGAPGPPAP